jgi:hypothetical protein
MSGELTIEITNRIINEGDLLGATIPNTEYGGFWVESYVFKKKIFAVLHPRSKTDMLATEISFNDLPTYTEDPILARKLYKSFMTPHRRSK